MARMTLEQIAQTGGRIDRKRVEATTDKDMVAQAKEDGTDVITGLGPAYPTPATKVPAIRIYVSGSI